MAQRIVYACTALEPNESCVQTWLDADAQWTANDPEQELLHTYYQALFDAQTRNRREAQRGFAEVIDRADALGLHAVEAGALVESMLLLAEVGDWRATEELRARAESLSRRLDRATQAQLHNAIGWSLLLARCLLYTSPSPRDRG